jgi:phage antirepressor YoqD-like protein
MAMVHEGWLTKKARSMFAGSQKRFFKIMAQGRYLAYYKKSPKFGEANIPNGVFEIKTMSGIEVDSKT